MWEYVQFFDEFNVCFSVLHTHMITSSHDYIQKPFTLPGLLFCFVFLQFFFPHTMKNFFIPKFSIFSFVLATRMSFILPLTYFSCALISFILCPVNPKNSSAILLLPCFLFIYFYELYFYQFLSASWSAAISLFCSVMSLYWALGSKLWLKAILGNGTKGLTERKIRD